LLGSLEYFRNSFATPIEKQQDEAATQTLRKLVYPFILRRTKDQVAQDLPPRSEEILWGDMESVQRKLYDDTRDAYRAKLLKLIAEQGVRESRFQVLEGLLRLRQICNDPRLYQPGYSGGSAKLTSLLETLAILQAEGHKVLVFSQFVGMLKLIELELKRSATPYAYLDGSTRDRQAQVDDFQQQQSIKIFLISLKAGGVGLNLTAADYVIHVDPWWNPAVEMQATDRAHRIGQLRPVFVYKLLMRDSVEEKILQLQERKRSLVKNLITTEAGLFKSLSEEDIEGLFS
jgi:non-specific serine/threonine protein kinase